jgi:hypothetical protein
LTERKNILLSIQATVTITVVPLPENEATGLSRCLGRCFHTGTYSIYFLWVPAQFIWIQYFAVGMLWFI